MQLLSNGMGTANSVMFPTSPSLSEAKVSLPPTATYPVSRLPWHRVLFQCCLGRSQCFLMPCSWAHVQNRLLGATTLQHMDLRVVNLAAGGFDIHV